MAAKKEPRGSLKYLTKDEVVFYEKISKDLSGAR
jgi:hypothetical protein